MSYHQSFVKRTLSVLLVLLIAFGTACKNEGQQASTSEGTNTSTGQTDTSSSAKSGAPQIVSIGTFKYLALHKDVLRNFFDPPQANRKCHKVVFRFVYDATTSSITIEAFGAKRNDRRYIVPPIPLEPSGGGRSLGPQLYLGDLELDEAKLALLGDVGDNTHLMFYPHKITTEGEFKNTVTYQIEWGLLAGFTPPKPGEAFTGQELNPSPPAIPGEPLADPVRKKTP